MSDDLSNEKRSFDISSSIYAKFLKLAYTYGWTPRGTVLYEGQVVEATTDEVNEALKDSSFLAEVELFKNEMSEQDKASLESFGVLDNIVATSVLLKRKRDELEAKGELKEPELVEGWTGGYLSNDGQDVLREDAINIAEALERALEDIPEIEVGQPLAPVIIQAEGEGVEGVIPQLMSIISTDRDLTEGDASQLLNSFSGDKGRALILDFIAFCREGENGYNTGY